MEEQVWMRPLAPLPPELGTHGRISKLNPRLPLWGSAHACCTIENVQTSTHALPQPMDWTLLTMSGHHTISFLVTFRTLVVLRDKMFSQGFT